MSGLETSLAVFFVGSAFLSLEVFELPYLLALLGAQLAVLVRAEVGVAEPAPVPAPAPADDAAAHRTAYSRRRIGPSYGF